MDIVLRLRQAIEANFLIVAGLDPNILDNISGTGFSPMENCELKDLDDSDIVTKRGAYHSPRVPTGEGLAFGPRRTNYVKQFDCIPFTQNIKLPKKKVQTVK